MKVPPCKKNGIPCTKRKPGCQDYCPDMHPFKEERKLISENRQKYKEIIETSVNGKKRMGKKRGAPR